MNLKKTINNFLYEQDYYTKKGFVKKLQKILPQSTKIFTYRTIVTFALTTQEMNVSHSKIAELFGVTRELFGLEQIPNFKEDIGKKYLLKTRTASFQYLKDFHFGEEMTIKMFVTNLTRISYDLVAGFYMDNDLRTVGIQKIIYNNMLGKPIKMPDAFINMLGLIELQLVDLDKINLK